MKPGKPLEYVTAGRNAAIEEALLLGLPVIDHVGLTAPDPLFT
jgi:hypothetical protein